MRRILRIGTSGAHTTMVEHIHRTPFLRASALAVVSVLLSSCALFRPERVEIAGEVTETLPPLPASAAPGAKAGSKGAAPQTVFVPGRAGRAGSQACATIPNGRVPGIRDRTIHLGTIQPMDGPAAQVGKPLYRATQAYVNDLNARGGIGGCKVQLHLQTACINCEAENKLAAKALVEQKKVFALVNTYMNTYAFNAAIGYLNSKQVPLVQGWTGTGKENVAWGAAQTPWSVYYTVRNDRAVEIYADWMEKVLREWGSKIPNDEHPFWVATVGLDVSQDRRRAREFKRVWEAKGGDHRVTTMQFVAAEEETVTRMDSFVAAMKDSDANGVFSATNITLLFGMQAAQRQSWKVPWVAKSAWGRAATDNCGSACDGGYTDNNGWGWIQVDEPRTWTPQEAQYMAAMKRSYPDGARYADAQTLGGWIGMMAFEYAATTLGPSLSRRGLIEVLLNLRDFETGVGATINTSASDHLGMNELMMLQICDNGFHRVSGWLHARGPMKRVDAKANDCGWGY